MHRPEFDQRAPGRLWLVAGTGEGPPLAAELLAAGWQVDVSVVSAEAARRYQSAPGLRLWVGALGSSAAVRERIASARAAGAGYRWLIDATHPFAQQVQGQLARGSAAEGLPLLRLQRQPVEATPAGGNGVRPLAALADLSRLPLAGRRLLLAIGSRHLGAAVASTPGALHHARVLPRPAALQLALGAGLDAERLACLQPLQNLDRLDQAGGAIERALCRRWCIELVLCRRSGPPVEPLWRSLATELGMELLLLEPPPPAGGGETLNLHELLLRLGAGAALR